MATYFCASGGSNTAPYDTWAKAATSLATALAAATSAGDVVVIQYNAVPTTDSTLSVDTSYTFAANIFLLAASNDGGSSYTPTAMDGTTNFIGSSSGGGHITLLGSDKQPLVYGIAFRNAGSVNKDFRLAASSGFSPTFDSCYFYLGTTGVGFICLSTSFETYTRFNHCTFRTGNGASMLTAATSQLTKCTLSSSGTQPTQGIFNSYTSTRGRVECVGCDFSFVTGTVVPNSGANLVATFDRCIFGSGATLLASQTTNPTLASADAFYSDCLVGTTRIWGHYNALGSAVRETGIYYTGGAAGSESWKVVTTANATKTSPYVSPWVDWHNTGTSAITPRFEIARDGSTTAYTDAQVWAEFSWKSTSSSPLASGLQSDWQGLAAAAAGTAGTNQATGAGAGSWTGLSGTAWSGKLDSGASITPTESGVLRGRIVVGGASTTLYVDPVIRTA